MQTSDIVESDSEDNDIPLEDNQINATQPEIENIIAQNQQLTSENNVLKTQLQNALDFQNEIKEKQKNLYDENSQLKTKLLESNQNIDQLKQRLQISQQKCQESENNSMKLESTVQKATEEKEALGARVDSLNNETNKLNEKIESINNDINNLNEKQSNFLNESSTLFEQTFSNLDDLLSYLQNSKKETDTKTSENNDKISSELQDMKKSNQQLLKKIDKYKKKLQEAVQLNQELENKYNACLTNQKKIEDDNSSVIKENQNMNNELDVLKEKLKFVQMRLDQNKQEREAEMEKYKKMSEAKDQRINELKKLVTDPIRSDSDENQKLIQELSETKGKLNDVTQSNSDLLKAVDILRSKLSKATYKAKKQKMVNSQLKKQFDQVAKKQVSNDEKVAQIANKNVQLTHENEDLQNEVDNLKTQLKAALASHVEGESAWNEKVQEVSRLNTAMSSIETIVEKQRKDSEIYSDEKKEMIQLIHKMYQMSLNYDSLLNDEMKKNADQQSQIKRLTKKLQKHEDLESKCQANSKLIDSIKEYLYANFDEKLKFTFIQILNDEGLENNEKILKVIETLNQAFQDIDDKLQNSQSDSNSIQTSYKDMKNTLERNKTLLTCLLSSFKRLLNGDPNQKMTDFLSIQIARLESQLRPDSQSPASTEENLNNIEDLKKRGFDSESAFELFTIQSLTNAELGNQLDYLRNLTSEQDEQIQQIKGIVGSNDLSEILDVMKSLKSENRKLQKMQKKMNENNVYQKENEELKETIDKLQTDLKSLVSDATTLQNELDLKSNQFNSLEESHSLLMKESSELQSKHLKEVSDFETIIDARNREIRDLTIKLTQLQSESTDQIERLKKSNNELKNLNEKRKNQFKKTVSLLQERKKNKEEQWSNRLKAAENHHKEEMDQCQQDIEALTAKLTSTTENSKKSAHDKDELNEKLADSLKKSEERNQKMTNDLSKLTIANKTLENKIQSMQEQMKRETQLLKTQFTFDSMKNETHFKETITELKTQMKKEKNDLIFLVLSSFDEIDDFDADDIDDETFKQTVEKLGKEFRKQKIISQPI